MRYPGSRSDCDSEENVLDQRDLIIVSNRGPLSIQTDENGETIFQRGQGGLVTALLGLSGRFPSTWIACAATDEDRAWGGGDFPVSEDGTSIRVQFIDPSPEAYQGYYQVISNPLLWFLQHSIWDFSNAPIINRSTWDAWDNGYVRVNRMFAEAVVEQVLRSNQRSLVMLQDYHLYLAPRMIRRMLRHRRRALLTHFIHIPWPGPEDWGVLPARMREAILDGLCAVDLLGFQTRQDALNFIRTCESLLPGVRVNYRRGRVILHNHVTHVRDFPISIDVDALREQAQLDEVFQYRQQLETLAEGRQIILRIDRTDPSKNIVRGFLAYDEMLETYPEHHGRVQFWAVTVPSRLEVEEYQDYLNTIMSTAGMINAKYGTSEWEPVRLLVGESYPRALAAMQLYDVLLVNPVADGMNLVAKEGPTINERSGVVVLSERAGAHQQLGEFALVVSPCDVSATAEALHCALTMPADERRQRAEALRQRIENEDIAKWMCWQLDAVEQLIEENRKDRKRAKN